MDAKTWPGAQNVVRSRTLPVFASLQVPYHTIFSPLFCHTSINVVKLDFHCHLVSSSSIYIYTKQKYRNWNVF